LTMVPTECPTVSDGDQVTNLELVLFSHWTAS
jgi:hypothetical protein